jgi:inorganic pyrophosphatase
MPMTQEPMLQALDFLFRSHPWHGVSMGPRAPEVITTYIEIVPTDTVKYEMDKVTGILRMDRPQQYSNVCPSLYGFVPQTLCAERVGALCASRTGRASVVGDGDPMDVCVLTEKVISHGDILVQATPIGGLRMLDGNEADDKIVAVLSGDAAYGDLTDIRECPPALIDRLRHYFLTYKQAPDRDTHLVEIAEVYGREDAQEAIRQSHEDYLAHLPELQRQLMEALRG